MSAPCADSGGSGEIAQESAPVAPMIAPDTTRLLGGYTLAEARYILQRPTWAWSPVQRKLAQESMAAAVRVFGFPTEQAALAYTCPRPATPYPTPAGDDGSWQLRGR